MHSSRIEASATDVEWIGYRILTFDGPTEKIFISIKNSNVGVRV